MSVSAENIAEVLGGPSVLGQPVRNLRDLEDIVSGGIPKSALDNVVGVLAGPHGGTATKAHLRNKVVPCATYQNVERLNLQAGQTTVRLARLYALALSAFEDGNAAARFLTTPHGELEGCTPFDVALTETGGREVEEVTERGLHGLPA
ncbi:MAG: DUF2384 domain-containing protein [Gammaproteobacteria bacterium]|nr:DUF2384 domain-containing protein [Gammaproteobacteria bacterium]